MSNIYLDRLRSISGMPPVQELPKVSKGAYGSFGSARTTRTSENDAPSLPDLLAQHGGFPGVDWRGLALIDATTSALWIVQRPDGLLTVLATVEPIPKPRSYSQAWPARFTTPEPADDCAPAAPAAHEAINRARHCTDCALWRTDNSRPTCLKGHRLAWRQIGPGGVRTVPSRADTARPCPDQRQD